MTNKSVMTFISVNKISVCLSAKHDYSRFYFILLIDQNTYLKRNECLNIKICACLVSI